MKILSYNSDYDHQLYELHTSAFTTFSVFGLPWSSDVPTLQSILTARKEFSPALSRLALGEKGEVLGHALWNPHTLRWLGKTWPVVILAPLGVAAEAQGKGVGSALIREGLEVCTRAGFSLALVVGHEKYYPRFGWKTGIYGSVGIGVDIAGKLAKRDLPKLRPLVSTDEPALRRLWELTHGTTPGVLEPDQGLGAWYSRVQGLASVALEVEGQVVGYARVNRRTLSQASGVLLAFTAQDGFWAHQLLAHLLDWEPHLQELPGLTLPLHPQSPGAAWFNGASPVLDRWDAGMALALPGPQEAQLNHALEEIQRGQRAPLDLRWGPLFDE